MFRTARPQRSRQNHHDRDPRRAARADVGDRREFSAGNGARDDDAIRQRIGISFQETKLSEKLTVRETLALFRSFYRRGIDTGPGDRTRRTDARKRRPGSESFPADRSNGWPSPAHWSAIPSCCFSTSRPRASIPGRDASCGRSFARYRRRGRTILITTHYLDEAERLCDRVAIVDHGKVIAAGNAARIDRQPGRRARDRVHAWRSDANGSANDLRSRRRSLPAAALGAVGAYDDHGRMCLSVSEPHKALPALLDCLESMNDAAGKPHHAPRQPGRRFREAGRPAPRGRGADAHDDRRAPI